ncbi:MAG: Fe-S cluster assembly protein SufD [Actinomycetota bacterium]
MTQERIETLTLKDLDQDSVTAWSRALGDPDWFLHRRLEALAALGKLERPSNREEAWRFTDPKRAGLDRHRILRAGGQATAEGAHVLAAGHADAASGGDVAGTELEPAGLVATVDGATAQAFLDDELAAKGVILTDLPTAVAEHAGLVEPRFMTSAAPFDEDWFLALHATLVTAGAFLYVPRGVEVAVPIGVLQRRTTAGATFAHTLVVVEPEASLTLVQQHGSPEDVGGRAFHHGVTELLIGERASVQYLSLQEWGSEQVNHFAVQRALVGRQGRFRSYVVTLGGGVVRVSPEVVLGEGAEADLLGAVFADAGQRFEHRANVTHAEPHARSSVLYKAGLLGGSRNIFNGNLIISPGARGTDAGQTMRNLVLSRDAHAEANPFLEILNSDVKAAHAAATGRVDDLHLFYLESRGIPRRTARRLVVFGFFEEVLAQVSVPAVRRRLEAALEAELEAAEGSGEPQGGAPVDREGSGALQGGAPVDRPAAQEAQEAG